MHFLLEVLIVLYSVFRFENFVFVIEEYACSL
jgi:hypothetical protein